MPEVHVSSVTGRDRGRLCKAHVCAECWGPDEPADHSGNSPAPAELEPGRPALLARLVSATHGVAEINSSGCLDACDNDGVLVVNPSPAGRHVGGRSVWFQQLLTPGKIDQLVAYLRAGGPGLAPLPSDLDAHLADPRAL